MPEGKCDNCGRHYYGWHLNTNDEIKCEYCEDGKVEIVQFVYRDID